MRPRHRAAEIVNPYGNGGDDVRGFNEAAA